MKFTEGDRVEAFVAGSWMPGTYHHVGAMPGLHVIKLDVDNEHVAIVTTQKVDSPQNYIFREGERCLAFIDGSWKNAYYLRRGNIAGEHFVTIDNNARKVINHEIQFFIR